MRAKDRAHKLAVTAFGIGYLPLAPGTWASAAAAVLYAVLLRLAGRPAAVVAGAAGALACTAASVRLWHWAVDHFGHDDPGPFVLDEVAGQWLACALVSLWPTAPSAGALALAAFIAFRLFDIWKPFPVRQAERLGGGWGIVLDDAVAALYAAAGAVVAITYVLPLL